MINLKKMQLRMKMGNEMINLPVAAVVEAEEVVGEEEVAVDLEADLETTMTKTKILEDLVVASVVMIKMITLVVDSAVCTLYVCPFNSYFQNGCCSFRSQYRGGVYVERYPGCQHQGV